MIYIIEIYPPLGNHRHQARYYLGWCKRGRLRDRLAEHRSGHGAAITRAAAQQGHRLQIAASMPGTPEDEKRFKRWKNNRKVLKHIRRSNHA